MGKNGAISFLKNKAL